MSGRRVVLLARAGGARDRTEAALRAADAELVATLDPAGTDPDEVRAAMPQALLVVLDPVVEQELERFEPLLSDDALDVMYEDADVAARREGWAAARWARHLRAKLHGHDDVLPPATPAGADAPAQATDAAPAPAPQESFEDEMVRLQLDLRAMPSQRVESVAPVTGAVVIAAGTGGPDAVRQLLAGLPVDFPRPVLLRQRIDGGQYDKLVRQMGRATAMPVQLAEAGEVPRAGHVYVMPDTLGLRADAAGVAFAEGEPGIAALRQADSALLLLSGADPALVDAAMSMRWAGGVVLGQSRENCFDPAASDALVARGGEALGLAELSRQLLDRWPA
ncbi:chemotaxis protein CheB [Thermomonas brevis]